MTKLFILLFLIPVIFICGSLKPYVKPCSRDIRMTYWRNGKLVRVTVGELMEMSTGAKQGYIDGMDIEYDKIIIEMKP